jgi:predicted TIM-barrel fold metal-dependent hydrolase
MLDERGAVVFVHPTHPVDTTLVNSRLPQPMIDYPHETTRTAVNLITSGAVRSHPKVKIILSHAGSTLPYLALRPAAMLPYLPGNLAGRDQPNTALVGNFVEDARSFYFDSALSAAPLTLTLLKEFAKPGHVLFGSDYPYAPTPATKQMDGLLDGYREKDEAFVTSVNLDAAKRLFPRLTGLLD